MNVEDALLSSTSQHRCTMSPCHHVTMQHHRPLPLRSGWQGSASTCTKKERLALYSSTFQIENYLKTSGYKRW